MAMKRILLALAFLFAALPAEAKSYICRSDGSIATFDNGEQTQVIEPLRQAQVEEMPLPPPQVEVVEAELPKKGVVMEPKKRSDFVPLTEKDIQDRGSVYN